MGFWVLVLTWFRGDIGEILRFCLVTLVLGRSRPLAID